MEKQLTNNQTTFAKALALALLLAASAVYTSASAQTARAINVSVPFEFVVGEERLPAGEYTVRRVLRDSERTLLVRSADGSASVTVHTNAAAARTGSGAAELVFTRHGDQHFLARLSTPGAATARAFPKSRVQRSLERELADKARRAGPDTAAAAEAKAAAAGETVTVLGRLR